MTDDIIKRRQSEVSREGQRVEEETKRLLKGEPTIKQRCIIGKGKNGKVEEKQITIIDFETGEWVIIDSEVLSFKYNEEGYYMDADIVVYDKNNDKIICVISSKKSFRERGAQSAYWAVKKRIGQKHFPYILVTPDNDNELFDPYNPHRLKKWRVMV